VIWTRPTYIINLVALGMLLMHSPAMGREEDEYAVSRDGKRISTGAGSATIAEPEKKKDKDGKEEENPSRGFLLSPCVRKKGLTQRPPGPVTASRPVCDPMFRRPIVPPPTSKRYTVIGVMGSDGIVLYDGSRRLKVRYFGVKAPRPNTPIAGAGAEANRNLMLGKDVRISFGRNSGDLNTQEQQVYVFVQDEKKRGSYRLINAYLIENGYASYSSSPGIQKYHSFFRNLERKAKTRGVGMWRRKPVAGATPVLPDVVGPETFSERLSRIRRARRPVAGVRPLDIPVREDKKESGSESAR